MNSQLQKTPYVFYAIIIMLLSVAMSHYTFPDALDIIHYYEASERFAIDYPNLLEYIAHELELHVDFIYLTLLYLCSKFGISLNVVTVIYLGVYYISICAIMRKYEHIQIRGLILFVALLCAPFCWVQSISRNLAAIATVYLAIYQFITGRKKLGIILSIAAFFTHFSILIMLSIVLASYYMQKIKIRRRTIFFLLLTFMVLAVVANTYFLDLIKYIAELKDNHYTVYSDLVASAFITNPYLSLGDKIPLLFFFCFSIYLILINSSRDFFFWGLLFLTILLGFSMFTSTMFVQRFMMMMPLFIACNICSVYPKRGHYRVVLYGLSIIGSLMILWNFWAYRLNFAF